MYTAKELEALLADAPDHAVVRVVSHGASTCFRKKGSQLTTTISTDWVQVRGHVGPTPKQLELGAILLRVDRVDFIEVTVVP